VNLFAAGGSLAYSGLEALELCLGEATTSNVLTIESTHGGASTTLITSGAGADVFNVEAIAGATTLFTGAGRDIVRMAAPPDRSTRWWPPWTRSTAT
jgi:hypothetical protein